MQPLPVIYSKISETVQVLSSNRKDKTTEACLKATKLLTNTLFPVCLEVLAFVLLISWLHYEMEGVALEWQI